ncbi:uncharacterized protein [Argopecten irradians]
MPPKRKAALANKAVSAQKRSRATAVEGPVPTTSSTAVPENDVSSNAIELLPTQLQHLVKEAYQKGLEEGRQAISTPASRETVDVNSQALPLSSTVTNDIPTTSPSVTIDSISTAAPPCSASLATHNFIGRQVQNLTSNCLHSSYSGSRNDGTGSIPATLTSLLAASLAPSTHRMYSRIWQLLCDFSINTLNSPLPIPVPVSIIALYVAHAHNLKLAASTITSHMSAIAFIHHMLGYQDPTKAFVVQKAILGSAHLSPSFDVRLPITEHILGQMIQALQATVGFPPDQVLYKAVFTTAFYGLARIGELLTNLTSQHSHILQIGDIAFDKQAPQMRLLVCFRHFKHNQGGKPHTVPIASCENKALCPVNAMLDYLKVRGPQPGALFITSLGAPLQRKCFENITKRCLNVCGLDSSRYKGHSFRIGGATLAANRGMSDSQIRMLGRWHSDAFRKYIRTSALSS